MGAADAVYNLFFKRSTLYIPFVLVGAFFANEGIDRAVNTVWESNNRGVSVCGQYSTRNRASPRSPGSPSAASAAPLPPQGKTPLTLTRPPPTTPLLLPKQTNTTETVQGLADAREHRVKLAYKSWGRSCYSDDLKELKTKSNSGCRKREERGRAGGVPRATGQKGRFLLPIVTETRLGLGEGDLSCWCVCVVSLLPPRARNTQHTKRPAAHVLVQQSVGHRCFGGDAAEA